MPTFVLTTPANPDTANWTDSMLLPVPSTPLPSGSVGDSMYCLGGSSWAALAPFYGQSYSIISSGSTGPLALAPGGIFSVQYWALQIDATYTLSIAPPTNAAGALPVTIAFDSSNLAPGNLATLQFGNAINTAGDTKVLFLDPCPHAFVTLINATGADWRVLGSSGVVFAA